MTTRARARTPPAPGVAERGAKAACSASSTTVSPRDRAKHIDPQAEAAGRSALVGFEADEPAIAKDLQRSWRRPVGRPEDARRPGGPTCAPPAGRPPTTASRATSSRVTQVRARSCRRSVRLAAVTSSDGSSTPSDHGHDRRCFPQPARSTAWPLSLPTAASRSIAARGIKMRRPRRTAGSPGLAVGIEPGVGQLVEGRNRDPQ